MSQRDLTTSLPSTMAGKPFKVGRFAHTLRVRLMREHLGIDVDSLEEDDLMERDPVAPEYEQEVWDPSREETIGKDEGFTEVAAQGNAAQVRNLAQFVGGGLKQGMSTNTRGSLISNAGSPRRARSGRNGGCQDPSREPRAT